jgi:amino acid transporter
MENTQGKLTKSMNIIDFFMLGFGACVGVGWSVAVNGWFVSGGGALPALLAFVIATLLIIPIGFCYAELTPAMPVAGGVVAFAYKAFGKPSSFIASWFVVLAYLNVLPWEAIYINDVLALMFPVLQSGEPLYMLGGAGIYPIGLVVGIVISLFIIFINWIGSRTAVKFQNYITIVLAVSGVMIIIAALVKADPSNLLPAYENVGEKAHNSFTGGLMAMLAMSPFFLAGFDTIPQGAEESSEKLNFKNLGKVLLLTVACVGGFYSLVILSTGMAMPWQEFVLQPRPAVSVMFKLLYPGPFGIFMYWVALIAALTGLFSTWNGCYIAGARVVLGMGRARLLPKFFARIHPKYNTPYGGNLLCAIATLAGPFIGIGLIDPLTVIGSTAFVVGWFFTALSCARLRKTAPDLYRPYKAPGGAPLAWIAAIISGILILITLIPVSPGYMGNVGMAYLVGWIILGLILYIGSSKYRNEISEEERVKEMFPER